MKYTYLTILALVFTFPAYSQKPDAHDEHSDHHAEAGALQMTLNKGQKWKMDDHTRSMFHAMTKRVEAGGDIKAVGKGLNSDLDQLIQGCTMTGEAHNQLHVFLTSFIPAVQEVAKTGSAESLKTVTDLLHKYPKYFK